MAQTKKKKYKDLFKLEKKIDLKNFVYDMIQDDEGPQKKLKLIYNDKIKINEITCEKIKYEISRIIGFEPASLFKLSITCLVEAFFKEKTSDILDKQELISLMKDNLDEFCGGVLSYISYLISSVTMIHNYPMITQPYPYDNIEIS
ncbi:MAG: hypothetical protein GX756_04575 [Clostridiales bacterium]|nr:hypothetical protein [Clostridiales bacterium]